ncbi:hypothetical protein ACWGJP_11775 [Microbacterium sp. NPDC055903]
MSKLAEIEKGYLAAQPARFERRASRRKRTPYLIGASVFGAAAIVFTIVAPGWIVRLQEDVADGFAPVRASRGPAVVIVGVVVWTVALWVLTGMALVGAFRRAFEWVDLETGGVLRSGRIARFKDLSDFDALAGGVKSGALVAFPSGGTCNTRGKTVVQTVEDLAAQRIHVWIEDESGRSTSAVVAGAAAVPWGRSNFASGSPHREQEAGSQ